MGALIEGPALEVLRKEGFHVEKEKRNMLAAVTAMEEDDTELWFIQLPDSKKVDIKQLAGMEMDLAVSDASFSEIGRLKLDSGEELVMTSEKLPLGAMVAILPETNNSRAMIRKISKAGICSLVPNLSSLSGSFPASTPKSLSPLEKQSAEKKKKKEEKANVELRSDSSKKSAKKRAAEGGQIQRKDHLINEDNDNKDNGDAGGAKKSVGLEIPTSLKKKKKHLKSDEAYSEVNGKKKKIKLGTP